MGRHSVHQPDLSEDLLPPPSLGERIISAIIRAPIALAFILPAIYAAWDFPAASTELTIGLILYLVLLVIKPPLWLMIVPGAIAALQLGFWSGRVYFSEFDLLLMITFGAVFWRRGMTLLGGGWVLGVMATVLLIYNGLVTWNGLFPYFAGGLGMWNDELSTLNSLREAKGFFEALLFLPLILAERRAGTNISRWFCGGMILGLIAVSASIVWERLVFTGLINFSHSYRVSGSFFGLLTGGAAIDAYLMMATPFIGAMILYRVRFWTLAPTFFLACLAGYSLYVTYSRANYPAVLAAFLVFVIGAWMVSPWRISIRPRHILAVLVVCVLGGVTSYHLYVGSNIERRFAQTTQDLKTRFDHWGSALRIMDNVPDSEWIGVGRGMFPLKYYGASIVAGKPLAAPALKRTGAENFISFTPGSDQGGIFLHQRLDLSAGDKYRLKLKLRAPHGNGERILVEFCERHVLKFRTECLWRGFNIPKGNKGWVEHNTTLSFRYLGKDGFGPFTRPVDISVMNRGIRERVDIGLVELHHKSGIQILQNSDFRNGLDHWFISHANHLRWHSKNVFLYFYFEGGAIGLVIFVLTLMVMTYRLTGRIYRNDPLAVLLASALAGVLFVGLFDSLFDDPRITFLFTLMIWLSLLSYPHPYPAKEGGRA